MNDGPKLRRRSTADPAWHPPKRRGRNPQSAVGMMRLMGVSSSPALKSTLVVQSTGPGTPIITTQRRDQEFDLLSPKTLVFASPLKGARTSAVYTPNQHRQVAAHVIQCTNRMVAIFLPEEKCHSQRWQIPATPASTINTIDLETDDDDAIKDLEVSAKELRKNQANSTRSQKSVTGISAKDALALAGIHVKRAHWLHREPYSVAGRKSQILSNLIIGTPESNGAMEMVNAVVKEIEKTHGIQLYLNDEVEWVPGFERIRLAQQITVIVSNDELDKASNTVSIPFDTLSTEPVCETKAAYIRKILLEEFVLGKENTLGEPKKLRF